MPRRRTHRGGLVAAVELHPFARQLVEMRGFCGTPIQLQIEIAAVVGEDKNEIRLLLRSNYHPGEKKLKRKNQTSEHGANISAALPSIRIVRTLGMST